MIFSILILSVVPSKKFIRVFRFCLRTMFALLFVRVKREYAESIDFSKRFIYMPNHVSIADAPICAAYMPEFITALEASEHFDWPIYGKLTKLYGNIPIDRKSVTGSLKSIQIAKDILKNSNSLVVFPEGSRTDDGTIGRFKKLPFQLAKDSEASIIPVGMSGVHTFNCKHSLFFRPSRIKLKFGKIIPAEKIATLSHEELMQKVHDDIVSLVEYN
jgi:1-acyl-sn-glycerol-3-phosphate acyltransferase